MVLNCHPSATVILVAIWFLESSKLQLRLRPQLQFLCVCVCCVLLLPLVIITFYYDLSIAIELLIDWCNAMFQMTFGEQNNEKESHDILNYAFEHGINALDTAEAVSYFFQSYLNLRFASFLLISPLVVS